MEQKEAEQRLYEAVTGQISQLAQGQNELREEQRSQGLALARIESNTEYSSFTNNTATTEYYLNFNLTNSVSTDSCYFYGVSVELWPNG